MKRDILNSHIKELLDRCNYLTDGTVDLSREEKFANLIINACIILAKNAEDKFSDEFAYQTIQRYFKDV